MRSANLYIYNNLQFEITSLDSKLTVVIPEDQKARRPSACKDWERFTRKSEGKLHYIEGDTSMDTLENERARAELKSIFDSLSI